MSLANPDGVPVVCVGCAWKGMSVKCDLGKSDGKNSWKLTCPECGEEVWVEEFLKKAEKYACERVPLQTLIEQSMRKIVNDGEHTNLLDDLWAFLCDCENLTKRARQVALTAASRNFHEGEHRMVRDAKHRMVILGYKPSSQEAKCLP